MAFEKQLKPYEILLNQVFEVCICEILTFPKGVPLERKPVLKKILTSQMELGLRPGF